MYVQHITEARSRYHSYSGKAISITYNECVFVALVIRHAKGMRRIILSSVACPGVPNFFHIVSKTARFSEGKISMNIKCVF